MEQIHENEFAALKRLVDAARLRKQLAEAGKLAASIDQVGELDRALDAYDHAKAMNAKRERARVTDPLGVVTRADRTGSQS